MATNEQTTSTKPVDDSIAANPSGSISKSDEKPIVSTAKESTTSASKEGEDKDVKEKGKGKGSKEGSEEEEEEEEGSGEESYDEDESGSASSSDDELPPAPKGKTRGPINRPISSGQQPQRPPKIKK